MVALNELLPDIALPDLTGRIVRLADFRGRIVALVFWSARCPWSDRADTQLALLSAKWASAVDIIRIAGNADEPDDEMRKTSLERKTGPVLLDRAFTAAETLGAVSTPHIFLVDEEGILRYRGALDDATMRHPVATRHYLSEAVDAIRQKRLPQPAETLAYGCAIVRVTG